MVHFPQSGRVMPPRSPRLNRHAVLDAALATIDKAGLQGLTIRTLAHELGAPPMTLYSHFKTKNALLDLAFERLLQRLVPPEHGSTWQAEVEEVCRHMRGVLLQHPHWIALLTRVVAPPLVLDVYDRLLGLMGKDGFRPEAAMFAFSSAMSLALGSVLVERMMDGPHPIPVQRLALVKGMLVEMPRRRYPGIVAAAPKFDRWSFDNVFELGLHSLIAGLAECCTRQKGDGKRRRRLA
jgi:AcrR family transcriptional regulator